MATKKLEQKDFEKAMDMKLDRLIVELKVIRKAYGNLPIVYSIDDEGNAFHPVIFSPTLMELDTDMELVDYKDPENPNCICIN